MASGMESFLTGFANQSAKGIESASKTFNKIFADNYILKMKQQIPEYEYRNVKGVGLVYVNKQDPNDVRVAIPEPDEQDKKQILTDSDVRSIGVNGGFAKDEDEQILLSYGIKPERIIKQDKGIMVIGEKQVQEDNKQKVTAFEKVAGEIANKAYYRGAGEIWHKTRFEAGEAGGPKYPVEVAIEEFNKIKDIPSVDPTNGMYADWLGESKVLTQKVINYQINDVLKNNSFAHKKSWWKVGRIGTEDVNLLKFIKSNLGNVDEEKITTELIRNQYEELKKAGTIKPVSQVEELMKKEKELMKLNYQGITDSNIPEINSMSELTGKDVGFEFMRGNNKYKIISFDKDGVPILDEVK